jgi:hypothetical protein
MRLHFVLRVRANILLDRAYAGLAVNPAAGPAMGRSQHSTRNLFFV